MTAMRVLTIEAIKVTAIGLSLGLGIGLIFGFPASSISAADAVCTGPLDSEAEVTWIKAEQARDMMEQGQIRFVDARGKEAYQNGHVAGAFHLPIEKGTVDPKRLAKLNPNQLLVVYCDTGGNCADSKRLAALLWAEGYYGVRVLEGGMPAWLEAGFPAEAGACQDCQ